MPDVLMETKIVEPVETVAPVVERVVRQGMRVVNANGVPGQILHIWGTRAEILIENKIVEAEPADFGVKFILQ